MVSSETKSIETTMSPRSMFIPVKLEKRDSLNTIYYYGRPFWCSLNEAYKKISNANHPYLLDLAKIKLSPLTSINRVK